MPTAEAAAQATGLKALTVPHAAAGTTAIDSWRFITLTLCMMAGTASLPHILMRYFTTPSVRAARQSVAWSLLFIFLLYFTAPALATFTKNPGAGSELRHEHHRQERRGGERARLDSGTGAMSAS